jgi:WD40 repeat protein
MGISKDRKYCITGQKGKTPKIMIWDVESKALVSKFVLPSGTRGVSAVGFSSDRTLFACTDLHNDHNVYVGDVQTGKVLFQDKGGVDKIFDLAWCKKEGSKLFLTVGVKHIKMWDAVSKKVSKGVYGKNSLTSFVCCVFGENGISYSGSIQGSIYMWVKNSCTGSFKVHTGSVSAINLCEGKIISGANDKRIVISDPASLTKISEITVASPLRSLDMVGTKILAGMRNGTIVEIENASQEIKMKSHSDGELWGLAVDNNYVITSCDDNRALVWDYKERKAVSEAILNEKPGVKMEYGASTLSTLPDNQCSRAIAINPKNGHIAFGLNSGEVQIREGIKNIDKLVKCIKDADRWIECIMYSPDGHWLAVGTHTNLILMYDCNAGYELKGKLTAHKAAILAIDFTIDSKYMRSNCNAYELLFFDLNKMAQDPNGATNSKSFEWATNCCKISWGTLGTFPPSNDFTFVKNTAISNDKSLLISGDTNQLVNVFNYPAVKGAKAKSLRGHSGFVLRTMFNKDDSYIFSIGGQDKAILQWKKC